MDYVQHKSRDRCIQAVNLLSENEHMLSRVHLKADIRIVATC